MRILIKINISGSIENGMRMGKNLSKGFISMVKKRAGILSGMKMDTRL